MGIEDDQKFAGQAWDMLREMWKGPQGAQRLAEQLFAIFQDGRSASLKGPVSITTPDGTPTTTPTLTLTSGGGDVTVKVVNEDGTGGLVGFNKKKGLTYTPDQKDTPVTPAKKKKTSSTVPGKVLSGSGSSYVVALYGSGSLTSVTKTVSVTQLQIATGETIPVGTWAPVMKVGSKYFFQVPVWQ
jgi:hypothetical protein